MLKCFFSAGLDSALPSVWEAVFAAGVSVTAASEGFPAQPVSVVAVRSVPEFSAPKVDPPSGGVG